MAVNAHFWKLFSYHNEKKQPNLMMGTGHRVNGAPMPLMGLPYRRYSVPETVMRKYSLSRAQTSESSESGVATVPTPSVPSASFRNNSEGQWSPGRKSIYNKKMLHKACQTSPRVSVEKEISKSDSVTKDKSCDNSDSEKTIPILHVTSEYCNDLDRKVSGSSESSQKSGDCSQLYCEETEYYQTYDAKKHNCDVTIPGAITEPSSVLLIVETNNADQGIIDVEETHVQEEVSKTTLRNDNKKIIDDLTQWISSEHIQYLLSNTTNTSILKRVLHEKSKSFPETNKTFSVFNQRSCSALGKLTTEEGINEFDDISIEQRTDSNCNDNTPTPIPPSTGQTEYHSSEGDCYVTDCEVCTAEGRKCCNMDDSYSQNFSFTSPEMISSNGFKTSSDFTSSSVTLDQTVSDRSTSTQDSTLSITSITPESYNSKSTSINISPLLVINTETFLIEPVESGGRSRDFTFHPSDSTPRTTPSPSKSEELRDAAPQILNDVSECVTIPQVINSESVLINPIKTTDVNINYALESINSDHVVSNDCKGQIDQAEDVIQLDDSQLIRSDLSDVDVDKSDVDKTEQTINSSLPLIKANEARQMDDNNINNIATESDNNLTKEIYLNCSVEPSIERVNFQLDHSLKVSSPRKSKSDDNESVKDQAGDDFEMDSLAFEDTGSSEDVTVTENTSNSFCGSENLIKKEPTDRNVKVGNIEDEVSSEDVDLLEQLGFCENMQKNKTRCSGNIDIETNYNEKCREQVQDMFYGNKKYELILKENKQNNNLFKGNVMTTREEKSTSAITSNLDKSNPQGIPLTIDDNECVTEFSLIGRNDDFHDKNIIVLKSDDKSMASVTGGNYWEPSGMEVIIPRYSAMPRTLSMLVNTSSMDYSSDSDLSLADSLEDTSISQRVNTFNKHDNRLVRGDVMALLPETGNISRKSFKGSRAYFLSLAGEEGEIKTEPIPDELKKKLLKRDNEIKKHSDHSSKPLTKKQESKRSKKYRHHSPIKHSTIMRKDKFGPLSTPSFDVIEKTCKSTQWEDNASSRTESSDTLVPSDTSEKDVEKYSSVKDRYDKETNAHKLQKKSYFEESNYNLNQTIGKKSVCNMSTNTDLKEIFQANNDCSSKPDDDLEEPHSKDQSTITDLNSDSGLVKNNDIKNLCSESESKQHIDNATIEENNVDVQFKKVNKCVQCIDSTFFDTKIDKEVSKILLEAYNEDGIDNTETNSNNNKHTKDAVTTTDLEESFNGEVSLETESHEEFVINDLLCSKSVQTDSTIPVECNGFLKGDVRKTTFSEMFQQTINSSDQFLHENILPSEAILLNSISNNKLNAEDSIEENRCKTPVFGEKQTDKTVFTKQIRNGNKHFYNSKQGPRFSVRTTPNRRIGNLNNRFRQRFEVIPEEKNGSMDSSAEEKTISPPPLSSRRRSIPMELLLMDGKTEKISASTSSNEKQEETSVESQVPQFENHIEAHRRHTIHGNLESQRNKTEYSNSFEKNEQNRRHTIHGNLALTPRNTALIKKLNLMGGTVLKGRVFSKRSGVMIGQFRPMNEETQIEKDEKSAVGEQLERLRRGGCKGRQALAVTQNQEHEELLTLSKGWINFYLLKDSQELGSDGSNGEEGSQNSSSVEEKLESKAPTVKTVTVVNNPEDKVSQYSVQIHAVPEQQTSETKLPDVKKRSIKSPKTPPQSPDCILPDITPTSSPNSPTPTLPDISKNELPQLQSDKQTSKADKRKVCNHRSGRKKETRERLCPSPVDSEKSAEYLKLLSPNQDSEKAFLTCSGDLACSEQSPSTITSSTCDSPAESPALPSIKWPARNLHRRSHPRYHRTDSTKHAPQTTNGTVGQACWTVTLAGSSGCPTAPPPDVEMRLSFPNNPRGAPTSQSDSGLGEDNFQSHSEKKSKRQQALPPSSGKQWTLSIKNPQDEKRETPKVEKRQFQSLPDVSYQPATGCSKKSSKRGSADHGSAQQLTIVWPKVQGILEQNLQRSLSVEWNEGLTVTGLAITPEQKPRVPTMSERDLTRNLYLRSRSKFSH